MPARLPRWDELTHRSVRAYRFRGLIMERLRRVALRTPWFDQDAVDAFHVRQDAVWAKYTRHKTVLEVGCGPGTFSEDVVNRYRGAGYAAVDRSPGMVQAARRAYPQYTFCVANASDLPFLDGAYDIVAARFLFHHLPVMARGTCLTEFLRVAKQHVIILDGYGFASGLARPVYEAYYRIADGSHYRHTLEEWTQLFDSFSARLVEQVDSGPRTVAQRMACWVLQSG